MGLVAINLILMEFMQNTIEKEERIKIAVLTEQKSEKSVLQIIMHWKKSMSVSEEKCIDYKNGLYDPDIDKAMDTDEALSFTQKLTESIAK